ncbi:hypothetical protein EDC04DRAFT_2783491 [Pisolithus marmoratus]|nr:hypothetical protein EDC04DRAFT_2783491 [Pisolithus marmoratus]
MTTLTKTIAVATDRGIVIADPQNPGRAIISIVPDFSGALSNSTTGDLKEVFVPVANCSVRGEIPALYVGKSKRIRSCTAHPPSRCFCSEFIEVHDVQTWRLDQVIEGADIRLLHAPRVCSVLTWLRGMEGMMAQMV